MGWVSLVGWSSTCQLEQPLWEKPSLGLALAEAGGPVRALEDRHQDQFWGHLGVLVKHYYCLCGWDYRFIEGL